ncbi:MAG: hypothetical protein LC754_08300, partial [Acidobacteria bacterium]|nr:hypothetical protein [Acidobacteriota bacterium]
MIATAPTKYVTTSFDTTLARVGTCAPDLGYFRRRYPAMVANFGTLARREEWLRRIWETDARWREALETRGGREQAREVVVRGAPPAHLSIEGEFDLVYAGGALALLHGAVMACRYGRRVLVVDTRDAGGQEQADWKLSEEELREFERAGLFTKEELESVVVN